MFMMPYYKPYINIGPLTITPLGDDFHSANTNTTSYTTPPLNLGIDDPNRVVLIGVGADRGAGFSQGFANISLGGVQATLVHEFIDTISGNALSAIYAVLYPTGATATLQIDHLQSMSRTYVSIASLVGIASLSPFDTLGTSQNTGQKDYFGTIDSPDQGTVFSFITGSESSGGTHNNFIGANELHNDGVGGYRFASAIEHGLSTETARNIQIGGTDNSERSLVSATFNFGAYINYANSMLFPYTGSDQSFTIPFGATFVRFKAWGGGGHQAFDSIMPTPPTGGYTVAEFSLGGILNVGDTVSIMTGQKSEYGNPSSPPTYGFGGISIMNTDGSDAAFSGAGLSGVFLGAGAVLDTDTARALIIAGAAGGNNYKSQGTRRDSWAGAGNDPTNSGGEPTMSGGDATANASGGGGGGYSGGTDSLIISNHAGYLGGNSGTGFVHASGINSLIDFSVSGYQPKNENDPLRLAADPVAGEAASFSHQGDFAGAGNGLVTIEWDGNVQSQIFLFTNADQSFTIPVGATALKIVTQGAGAAFALGGAGDYIVAEYNVSDIGGNGAALSIMVGRGGEGTQDGPIRYGFAGAGHRAGNAGGLSGVFTGPGAILATDTARAVQISGAGGGHDANVSPHRKGGSGGDLVFSGGAVTMQGDSFSSNPPHGGGGGGYSGGSGDRQRGVGSAATIGGEGGSSYVLPAGVNELRLTAPDETTTTLGSSHADYVVGTGNSNQHGFVAIYWY